jgi:hypothetical protein
MIVPTPKICKGCGLTKLQTDFYRHPQMADGLLNYCKSCFLTRQKQRRSNLEVRTRIRAHNRLYSRTPKERERRKTTAIFWRQQNPKGYRAHNAANNAVRDGKLIRKPCQSCGAVEHVHKHHPDYAQPLDVIWLCASCHHCLHIGI